MSEQQPKPVNLVELKQNNRVVTLVIQATSEEIATNFYNELEKVLITWGQLDLELNWKKDQ
jgi:hypothetical protein